MYQLSEKPLGILYGHEDHYNPLLQEIRRRGLPFTRIDPSDHVYELAQPEVSYSLLVNDMSAPPYHLSDNSGIAQTIEYLRHIEKPYASLNSSRIVNGSRAAEIFSSRTRQLGAIAAAGLPFPRTHVVSSIGQLLKVSSHLSFPILVKGNRPHTPVLRFKSEEALIHAYLEDKLLGTGEHTWLIQECIPLKGNHIVRVETLNGRFLYAVKLYITGNDRSGWPLQAKVEAFTPDPELIAAAETLARTALIDFGAVEYLTDRRTNDILFFSIRPHTTSFSTPPAALHTKPFEQIADYLEGRLSKVKEIELAL
jgi:hypothetical protein